MPMTDEYRKAMQESATRPADGEDREYDELEDGFYLARCEKVVEGDKAGPSGYPQTRFQWRMIKPSARRVQSDFVSMSPAAAWRMRMIFDACDLTYDSEPEEVVGETAIIQIEQQIQERGQRKGEMVAKIVEYFNSEDPTYKALVGS
jgi:hypothetical protein